MAGISRLQLVERVAVDPDQRRRLQRGDIRRAARPVRQREFAHDTRPPAPPPPPPPPPGPSSASVSSLPLLCGGRDLQRAIDDDVDHFSRLIGIENRGAGREPRAPEEFIDADQFTGGAAPEKLHTTQFPCIRNSRHLRTPLTRDHARCTVSRGGALAPVPCLTDHLPDDGRRLGCILCCNSVTRPRWTRPDLLAPAGAWPAREADHHGARTHLSFPGAACWLPALALRGAHVAQAALARTILQRGMSGGGLASAGGRR